MPALCVIEGDGIGHEVVPEAVRVLQAALPGLEIVPAEAGWDCFVQRGVSVPDETLAAIRRSGAALFGAVSSPSRKVPGYRSAIITMRQALDLYANLRPVQSLPGISPRQDVDLLLVRENTEGLYAGRERLDGDTAIAERVITRAASYRIGWRALELAASRAPSAAALASGARRLTIVHKANILPVTDGLFRDTVRAAAQDFARPGAGGEGINIQVDELLVDVAAFKLVAEPQSFDVIVTTNLFGDILSDEAAYWCGGMGLAPSLNWGEGVALAEPVHGSAPDIAGKGIANPIATILSAALLARYAWRLPEAASRIEDAVKTALAQDIPLENGQVVRSTPTAAITQSVLNRLKTS
jgi:homoisocitrate dehydrogenase